MGNINNSKQLLENLEPSASLGYPVLFVTHDGGVLCDTCVKENKELIIAAIEEDHDPQWDVRHCEINWENQNLTCSHCDKEMISAYLPASEEA